MLYGLSRNNFTPRSIFLSAWLFSVLFSLLLYLVPFILLLLLSLLHSCQEWTRSPWGAENFKVYFCTTAQLQSNGWLCCVPETFTALTDLTSSVFVMAILKSENKPWTTAPFFCSAQSLQRRLTALNDVYSKFPILCHQVIPNGKAAMLRVDSLCLLKQDSRVMFW